MAFWRRDKQGGEKAASAGEAGGAGVPGGAGASAGGAGSVGAAPAAPSSVEFLQGLPGMAADVRPVRLVDVRKSYGEHLVLPGVTLTLDAGGVYCLMAPSGSGKTTMLRVLLGLEPPDGGSVEGVRPGCVAMMFQEDRLCETLTPVENVALVLPPDTRRSDVGRLLEEVLPPDSLDRPAMQLSGGMRRRVSLARAVAFPSDLVVLDEPFTGLDTATRRQVIAFVLRHRLGRTLLVATHGEDDARLLGAEVVRLDELTGVKGGAS